MDLNINEYQGEGTVSLHANDINDIYVKMRRFMGFRNHNRGF